MSNGSVGRAASAVVTAVIALCAVTMTTLALRRGPAAPAARKAAIESQTDWRTYAIDGHRIGPPDAKAVLVEFADFQCPACRRLEDRLRVARKRFPLDFAVVYRHFPLNIHKFARQAAVASECGAQQSRFPEMHDALFDVGDSLGVVPWTVLAARAGVASVPQFAKCMSDSTVIALVTRDVDAAKRLGARATPTLLIDGVRATGTIPQSTLDSLVQNAIKHAMKD